MYENKLDITKAIENIEVVTDILKFKYKYEGDINLPCQGYWLLPDGVLLDCKAHGNIDKYLIDEGYVVNLDNRFNVYDGSQVMDYLNAVRIRNEVPHRRYPAYLTLPVKPLTSSQYRILDKWLEDILLSIKTYLIIDNGHASRQYRILEDDKAKEDIRNYYRVGEFI